MVDTDELLRDLGYSEWEIASISEILSELGSNACYEGDTSALFQMSDFFYELGLYDQSDYLFDKGVESSEFWTIKEAGTIYYDDEIGKWRDSETDRVTIDPYEYLMRGAWE